ncbi:MAG: hypothetical protein PEPC_00080 [Peptostreptococcus russellii]
MKKISLEDLKQLKELLDQGIITEKEFEIKKNEYLNGFNESHNEKKDIYSNTEVHYKEKNNPQGCFKVGCFSILGIFIFLTIIPLIFGGLEKENKSNSSKVPNKNIIENKQNKNDNATDPSNVSEKNMNWNKQDKSFNMIYDANKYGSKDRETVISSFGSPNDTDNFNWTSNTNNKNYNINTLIYKVNNISYEFWIYDNKVVRVRIESESDSVIDFYNNAPLEILGLDEGYYDSKKFPLGIQYAFKSYNMPDGYPDSIKFMDLKNSKKDNEEIGHTTLIQIIYDSLIAG